uniref:Uncharacterized protein n=1 Tax=Avena sativa TaxID=4498 RepID=A0ACD5WHZ6_AVESA
MTGQEGCSTRRGKNVSAGNPVAAEMPATDKEGRCPTKRKSSGEREASDMLPEQDFPTEHWAYTLYNAAAATANHKLAVQPATADDLFSEYDAELRKRVKSVLLRFPESYALGANELEQAIDRIVKESKPETASVAAQGMDRLEDDVISVLLVMVKHPTVDELLGGIVEAGGVFPPRWLDERKKYLDEQCRPEKKTFGQSIVLVDKVRVDLLTKGYVEVHEDYMDDEESRTLILIHMSTKGGCRWNMTPRTLRPLTMTAGR